MRRLTLGAVATLVLGGALVASLALATRAADRPAERIVADIDAIEIPKLDPDK